MAEHLPSVRLDGQVAVVTGAGRGIGRAVAVALSRAGAAVAVCARSENQIDRVAREITERKGHALAVRCDVLRRHEVEDMVTRVARLLGPIDLLVNNAGQFGPVGPIAATDPDEWWKTFEVNVRGPLYCTRAVLPAMSSRGHGRIINVSTAAAFAAVPMLSAYIVSKTALFRLTESVAEETREHGVSVFTVIPGLVRTAMTESAVSCGEPHVAQWFTDAFANNEDVSTKPVEDIVVFLASGAADVLTGRDIVATDDVAAMISTADKTNQQDRDVLRP